MTSLMLVVALIAFLAGVTATVFLMLFIGIRKGDRPERVLGTRNAPLDACARSVLGSRTWPNVPVYRPATKTTDPEARVPSPEISTAICLAVYCPDIRMAADLEFLLS